jgi:type IV pilus assembly protein PilY1
MIDFGTGQYLQNSDVTAPYLTQSLYGIWDSAATVTVSGRSKLQQQTVLSQNSTAYNSIARETRTYRLTSANTVDWTKQLGWYMDFPNGTTTGERVAYNGLLRNDRFVVPTLIPSATPCLAGGSSWLMEIDALTGARSSTSPFDIYGSNDWSQGGNSFTDPTDSSGNSKITVGGVQAGAGIFTTPTVIKSQLDPTKEYKYASTSAGQVEVTPEQSTQGQSGRITWREINN